MSNYLMSEVNDRLATIEANQKNTDKQIDRLVNVVEEISKTQSNISLMQYKIDSISDTVKDLRTDMEKTNDRLSQIESTALQNKMRIAMIATLVTAAVSGAISFISKKIGW